jgi:hypothetical protein
VQNCYEAKDFGDPYYFGLRIISINFNWQSVKEWAGERPGRLGGGQRQD